MKKHDVVWRLAIIAGAIMIVAAGCYEKKMTPAGARQKEIALGEKIFAEKQCGKCHSASAAMAEMKGPDLTSVFLAVDTVFVKAHLQFIELSAMPPLDLKPQEIAALTQYVATLHAKAKVDPRLKHPDGACPVCGAALKQAEAMANGWQTDYQGKSYYFECSDCKRMFERDARWYAEKSDPATK
jgi:mono/diheme cytochrome c family protein/YHS domain-containing protein